MSDSNDNIDELLTPLAASAELGTRDAILRLTQQRLARGKWLRRGGKLAAVAAVFAVGVGVGLLREPRDRETVVTLRDVEFVAVPVVVPVMISADEPTPQPPPTITAARLELNAELADDPAAAAKLYREAGDRFLNEQDYVNAARCYRIFLIRTGDTALSPEMGDSWLLTSLKNAAFREKNNAEANKG